MCKDRRAGVYGQNGIFYGASYGISVHHLLRRTLVLQQFYLAIVAVACPELVEGFGNPITIGSMRHVGAFAF